MLARDQLLLCLPRPPGEDRASLLSDLQPLHRYFGIPASARASLYIYNTQQEVDMFIDALKESIKFFKDIGTM